MKVGVTVLTGFVETIDGLHREGVTNSSVCLDQVKDKGYRGGLTALKITSPPIGASC